MQGRPLGGVEFAVELLDRARSLNFVMIAQISGPLTEEKLRAGLDDVQRRHPLLRARLIPYQRERAFDLQGVPKIPLRSAAPQTPVDWLGQVETELRTPFVQEGPLIRCGWFPVPEDQSPSGGTLLLTFHHSISDGTSGAYLLRDLLQSCAAQPLEPMSFPQPIEAHMPAGTQGIRGLLKLASFALRQLLFFVRLGGLPRRISVEAECPVDQVNASVIHRALPPELLAALRARAKQEGTTVHGALSSAMMLAFVQEELSGKAAVLGFGAPVNMRDRMEPPVGEDVGLYVSMAQSAHRVSSSTEFWQLAKDAKHQLAQSIQAQDPFCFVPVTSWFISRMMGRLFGERAPKLVAALTSKAVRATTGLTNLGVLQISGRYGALEVQRVHFAAAPSAMANLVATAATFNNTLLWNFIYNAPRLSQARMERYADACVAAIERAVKT